MKLPPILLPVLVLLSTLGGNALNLRPDFRHYSSADGLPSNCIRDIAQDSCGFLWFATDDGLTRFDGLTFKTYKPSTVDCETHVDNYVSSLAVDGQYIWLATDNRLMRLDKRTDRLEIPPLVSHTPDEEPISLTARCLTLDHDGNLWMASGTNGVYRIDRTFVTRHYRLPDLPGDAGNIYVDRRGDVWATGSNAANGLYRFDTSLDTFIAAPVYTPSGQHIPVQSMAMVEDANNRLWIGTWNAGLVCYDPFSGTGTVIRSPDPSHLFHIHSMVDMPDGTLLIGNDAGLTSYDPSTGVFTLYSHDELRPGSLSGQFVYPIVVDREGGLWVGTFYTGVNYHAPEVKHFESSHHSRFVNSVSGDIISSFCQDDRGNVYIGSEDGGVCRLDIATGHYEKIAIPGGTANVHSLCRDGKDLWIGTYAGGIKIYDTVSRRIRRDTSAERDNLGNPITACYALFKDRQGNMWASTMESILRYNRDSGGFENMLRVGALTSDIKQDSRGSLWFSTQGNGIYRYDQHTGQWHNYRADDRPGSLIHDHVSCIDFDPNGTLWAATGNGLGRYVPDTDTWERVDVDTPSQLIFFVKAAGNDLWLGTANGLARYTPSTGECTTYTVVDGLPGNQFSLNSVYGADDGTIYAGTVSGFVRFDPARVGVNEVIPTLRFTGLEIGGRPVEVGDPRLPVSLNSLDCLRLSPDDNAFSIKFAALSFANPSNNAYEYRLEGFDREWLKGDLSGRVSYTSLPPGDYTLRVRASNNDRQWNAAGISLPIHIAPHWYNTWPMKLLYVAFILLAVGSVGYLVVRRNNRRHREELALVKAAQEREVYEAKLNFFTTIAHEIRTPVSLIIGPLESVMKSSASLSPAINEDIDIIHRNSERLITLVNQLLDFKKVESLALDARFVPTDIVALVESICERFRSSLRVKGVNLYTHLPDEPLKADVDAEALTKLVSNLLNNARKFTHTRIDVTLAIAANGETFSIEVSDDGPGIESGDIKAIFKPFVQLDAGRQHEGSTGLGLSIVKRVVTAHSGTIDIRSAADEGTAFVVTLPVRQATASPIDENSAGEQYKVEKQESKPPVIADSNNERPVMLVADDNTDLIHFLERYFAGTYTMLTATSADEAIGILDTHAVDLIVSDWMMPGMSGVDFCRHVRQNRNTSHIPFVLLTARTDDDSKIEGLNCGADAYIEKPFSVDYLGARINNLLEMRRMLRAKFSATPLEPIDTLAANSVDSEFLASITALIEENFANPDFSVDDIARAIGISRSGLYAKIRTLVDTTPNELIQLTRLKRAAKLLTEGRYRISEICYMVGFNSPSYFAKCFQRQFGMKPGEFKG